MRVAILGPGALGTLLADALAPIACVTCVGRTGGDDAIAAADVLLVTLKAYDTAAGFTRIGPFLGARTTVVTLQNGLDAATVLGALVGDPARVVHGITTESATRRPNGTIARGGVGITQFPREPRAAAIASLFAQAGLAVEIVDDFARAVWRKAIANAAINPVTALAGVPNGALMTNPILRERALRLAAEAVAVALGEDIRFAATPDAIVQTVVRASATNRSSMLQDRDAGRAMEVDALVDAVIRRAARAGIAVPQLRAASAALRSA